MSQSCIVEYLQSHKLSVFYLNQIFISGSLFLRMRHNQENHQ
jgi:hypothetical protein